LALVLKSPTQMGWLSIINSVTNISRLGTFKGRFYPQLMKAFGFLLMITQLKKR
jgi:hypothetical protein